MTTRRSAERGERDEAYYERVREALDEDAIANRRIGWDDPDSMLSMKYRSDPLLAARAARVRKARSP